MATTRLIRVLDGPVDAVVSVPGSKSIANRALICAALARGTSGLANVPDGDDTTAMLACLRELGLDAARDRGLVSITGAGSTAGSTAGSAAGSAAACSVTAGTCAGSAGAVPITGRAAGSCPTGQKGARNCSPPAMKLSAGIRLSRRNWARRSSAASGV